MKRPHLTLAVALFWTNPYPQAAAETMLGTVVVESERIEEPIDETAAHATITAEQLRREMAISIKDAVRYEAGVSVSNNPSRFGQRGFNIRGVDGDRVAMQIDGIGLPDEFKTGGFSDAGRNLVDIRLLKKIDIQRGSGSVMYGSGALGGAVNYVTPDPEDYLIGGRRYAGRIETQYIGAHDARALLPVLAFGGDRLKFLASGVFQRASETESFGRKDIIGPDRDAPNPQSESLGTGLLKLVMAPSLSLRTSLTWEEYARDVETNLLSQIRGQATSLRGEDFYRRSRVSIEQHIDDLAIGKLKLHVYAQRSNTFQNTYETRRPIAPANWEDVIRSFDYDQDSIGLRVMGESTFQRAGAHRLFWGLEASRRESLQMRGGETRRTSDGYYKCLDPNLGVIPGPTPCLVDQVNDLAYPDRDFPPSTIDTLGLYAQDNWLLSDAWSLTLGFRYDRQELKIDPDIIYLDPDRDGTYKTAPQPKTSAAVSPKLGATWRFRPEYALSLSYNFGFRAPPYDSVNYGFDNSGQGYISVPNVDLEPEYSRGPELKLERQTAFGRWAVSAYRTDYVDFIEMESLCDSANPQPTDPPICAANPGRLVFQSINLPEAWIQGIEVEFLQRIGDTWRLRSSLTYAKGRDYDGNPINSIDPLKGVFSVAYMRPAWEIEAALTLVDAKHRKNARRNDGGGLVRQFLPKGYGVLDLRAHWHFARNGRASFGILNALDRKYVHWADVPVRDQAHIADSGTGPDRYTQPGRHFSFSLSYGF